MYRKNFVFSRLLVCFIGCPAVVVSATASAEMPFEYQEGFESGSLNTDPVVRQETEVFKWKGGTRTLVTPEKAKSGSYSLRFHYPASADGKDSHAEQRFLIPQGASEVTFEYDLYVPRNFHHREQETSENNKFMFLWSGKYGTVASDQSVGFEYWPAFLEGGPRDESVLSHHLGPGQTDWRHKTPTRKPVFSAADRGKWVNFQIYVKFSSESGRDGRLTVTKNGSTLFDVQNIANYSSSGNFIDQGYLLGWSNSGFDEDTYFYLDNFKVTVGTKAARPNPPVLEQPR